MKLFLIISTIFGVPPICHLNITRISSRIMISMTFFQCYNAFKLALLSRKLQDTKLLSYKLQNRNIAKLQVARQECWYAANSKIWVLLSYKLQDRNVAKLQVAKQKHCYVITFWIGNLLSFRLQDTKLLRWKLQERNIAKMQVARYEIVQLSAIR